MTRSPNNDNGTTALVWSLAAGVATTVAAVAFFVHRKRRQPNKALDPQKYKKFRLVKKDIISHDTRIFRFALDSSEDILGLPIGQHMFIRALINGKSEMRQYTPVTGDEVQGYFDLLIKVYFKNVHPKFPDGGKLTQYMESMQLGETIDVMGPKGRFNYEGLGQYNIGSGQRVGKFKKLGMIAGGSGITPMLQVLKAVVRDPRDTTEVWLLFGNQTEADILCHDELKEIAKEHPTRFHLHLTLDRPPSDWNGFKGFVDDNMLKSTMPPPGPETFVVMCGPPPMINMACKPNLKKLGYADDSFFSF